MTEDSIESDDPEALLRQAAGYHQEKRLHEAESIYLLLLEHLPHVPEINNLYALLLTQTDRSEEAIPYLMVVAKADPSDENLMRLSMICLKHGQNTQAVEALKTLLNANPAHMEGRILHARALQADNKHRQALLEFNILLKENPDSAIILHHMAQCIHHYKIDEYDAEIENVFCTILQHPDIYPQKFFHNIIGLLFKHPAMTAYLDNKDQDIAIIFENLHNVLTGTLFTIILDDCLIVNKNLEILLTRLRRYFLECLAIEERHPIIAENATLICHMANQCFYNEYVYLVSGDERKILAQIPALLTDVATKPEGFDKCLIGMRACYDGLYQTDICDVAQEQCKNIRDEQLNTLIRLQITEPLMEADFASSMPALGVIGDPVSQKVRAMYEESPYPRWVHYSPTKARPFLESLAQQLPNIAMDDLSCAASPNILIAGGGTGQHPISTARIVKNSKVTAIDLSRRSLSYAKRKAGEMDVKNITFLQADILDLDQLDQKFDVIESVGVIHHMESPRLGLAKLHDQLLPGGYMKIGLYSKAARQHLSLARDKIAQLDIHSDFDSIRQFRQTIFQVSNHDPLHEITKAYDFYALSTCRDLLFHVQEHLFTVPEIESVIEELGMEFLGFTFPDSNYLKAFKKMFPVKGAERKLNNWASFEEKAPNFFGAMYVFWLRKPV